LSTPEKFAKSPLGGYFIVSVSPLHDSEGKLTGCIHVARDITKRKQVKEALRESEERLSFALETSHTGAWDLDLVDHTSYRSLEHDRIFGYEQLLPQWTYEMFLDHVLPEDREMVDTKFRKATATRSDWSFECQIRRVDGAVRWIWAAGRHHLDSTGSARRIGGIVQDITERKQAEEALRQSEKRYRMLFDNSMDAIVLTDPRGGGKILSANQAACRMLGWSEEELIGKGRDVMFDLQDPALSALLDECALSGSARAHITYRRKDGTNFPGEVSTASFTDSNGEPRIVAIIRDITERKKAEEALRESEKRERARSHELAAVLDAVPVSVYITHDPQALKITGNRLSYEWQRIPVGTNFSRSAPEGVRPEMFKLLRDGVEIPPAEMPSQMAAAGIEVNDCELDIVSADGKIRHVFGNARPLRDEQGNLRGSISAFIDITKRKEAETKLKETLDNLENLVKERTAELEQTYISLTESEKGLADAQKMAHIGNWDWNSYSRFKQKHMQTKV
jgi:PAS domain S-box-containing protein